MKIKDIFLKKKKRKLKTLNYQNTFKDSLRKRNELHITFHFYFIRKHIIQLLPKIYHSRKSDSIDRIWYDTYDIMRLIFKYFFLEYIDLTL